MSLDSFSLRIEIISRTRRVEGLKVGERSLPTQKLNCRHHLFEDMKEICMCVCKFSPKQKIKNKKGREADV